MFAPVGGYDDDLCALCNQFAKCFGECEVPADQHADFADWGVKDFVRVGAAGCEVWAFRVPYILFAIFPEDGAGRGDEVGGVVEGVVFFCFVCGSGVLRFGFDDCARDDVDL